MTDSEAVRIWQRPLQRLRELSRRKLGHVVEEHEKRPRITIEADRVYTLTERGEVTTPLPAFLDAVAPRRLDSGDAIIPRGVKYLLPARSGQIIVHETQPQNHRMRWLGREVVLNLPYVIVFAVIHIDPVSSSYHVGNQNEVFFRNEPLLNLDDELLYPAFLNTSCHPERSGRSGICLGNLRQSGRLWGSSDDAGGSWVKALRAVVERVFYAGFNHDMDRSDAQRSWFTETARRGVDSRISSLESWEAATRQADLAGQKDFAVTVPWLRTGCSVRQVAERIRAELEEDGGARSRPIQRLLHLLYLLSRLVELPGSRPRR